MAFAPSALHGFEFFLVCGCLYARGQPGDKQNALSFLPMAVLRFCYRVMYSEATFVRIAPDTHSASIECSPLNTFLTAWVVPLLLCACVAWIVPRQAVLSWGVSVAVFCGYTFAAFGANGIHCSFLTSDGNLHWTFPDLEWWYIFSFWVMTARMRSTVGDHFPTWLKQNFLSALLIAALLVSRKPVPLSPPPHARYTLSRITWEWNSNDVPPFSFSASTPDVFNFLGILWATELIICFGRKSKIPTAADKSNNARAARYRALLARQQVVLENMAFAGVTELPATPIMPKFSDEFQHDTDTPPPVPAIDHDNYVAETEDDEARRSRGALVLSAHQSAWNKYSKPQCDGRQYARSSNGGSGVILSRQTLARASVAVPKKAVGTKRHPSPSSSYVSTGPFPETFTPRI